MASIERDVAADDDHHQSMRIDVAAGDADAYRTFRMDRKTLNSSWNSSGASNAYDACGKSKEKV